MTTLSERLREIQRSQHLTEKELAELTGVPQSTLTRILNGTTTATKEKTLKALSHFFNLTLASNPDSDMANESLATGLQPDTTSVPILEWTDLAEQLERLQKNKIQINAYVSSMMKIEGEAYALIIKDSAFEPRFVENSYLIVKRHESYKNRDYVVIESDGEVTLKQLLIDRNEKYVKSLVSALNCPIRKLNTSDKLLGVLVQTIIKY